MLAHKLREAIGAQPVAKLSGEVEVDGAYVGGHVRQENEKADRKDRRHAGGRARYSRGVGGPIGAIGGAVRGVGRGVGSAVGGLFRR